MSKFIELFPLTEKADKIVAEYGDLWILIKKITGSPFPTAKLGTWILARPYSATQVTKAPNKWFSLEHDEDFNLVIGNEDENM